MIVFTAIEVNGYLGIYLINSQNKLRIFLHMDDHHAGHFDQLDTEMV